MQYAERLVCCSAKLFMQQKRDICRRMAGGKGCESVQKCLTALAIPGRGKYADVPFISESVYLQVDASM